MELYSGEHEGDYTGATLNTLLPHHFEPDHYRYEIINLTDDTYTLEATPDSLTDKACGRLSLDQLGDKTSSGIEKTTVCWGE